MLIVTIATFAIALVLGLILVPAAKAFGRRIGLVDHPDRQRKLHAKAVPLVGGIAVFVTTVVTVLLVMLAWSDRYPGFLGDQKVLGLLLASLTILIVGIIDDRFKIRGRQKLAGQIIAASILIYFNYRFEEISVFGQNFRDQMQIVYILVAYGWILVGINSVNLLDGADGFAPTIGIVTSVALCIMAFWLGNYQDAMLCAAMAGALVAFMRFNFPPASAFLGDAGSMLIGLFIAAMAIKSSSKQATAYAFLAPIALLAIPLFDTLAAIVRRRLTGRSIYAVDRGHLHHALMSKGFGPRKALLLFFAMCLMTAIGGTMALIYQKAEFAALAILSVAVFLIVGRLFGVAEYQLISNRSASALRSFFTRPGGSGINSQHATVRLQGERNWDECWKLLREFAERHCLSRMTMDLNLPWIHESFHAKYKGSQRKIEPDEQWSLELPLLVKDRLIGRIDLHASVYDTSFSKIADELNIILQSLEKYFLQTIGENVIDADAEQVAAQRQSLEFGPATLDPPKVDVGSAGQKAGPGGLDRPQFPQPLPRPAVGRTRWPTLWLAIFGGPSLFMLVI